MACLKTCCCCLSLRTGCIIIGVLEILGHTTSIAMNKLTTSVVINGVISLFAAILLIYGAARRNRHFLRAHIIVDVIKMVLIIIVSILCAVAMKYLVYPLVIQDDEGISEARDAAAMLVTIIIILSIALVIKIWFIIVIYSHISEIREEFEARNRHTNGPSKLPNV